MPAGEARGGHGRPQTAPTTGGLGGGVKPWGDGSEVYQVGGKKGLRCGRMMETEGVCIINPSSTEEETWTQKCTHLTTFPRTVWPQERGPSGLGQKTCLSFDQKRTMGPTTGSPCGTDHH